MSTPGGRRRDTLGPIHSSSRRQTQKQLREAASQPCREGQLLRWLVGEGRKRSINGLADKVW